MIEYEDYRNARGIHGELYAKLVEWASLKMRGFSASGYLASLLGIDGNYIDIMEQGNEDTLNTIRMLNGPNGYAIYKVILARKAK